ncbi:MAG: allantoinase AllB [Pyrinomonadaceae bacterium]|nr:allantoinase AllB [Pyrinomonadaceae bacterium]
MPATSDILIRARRVVTPDGVRPASIRVSGGRIRAVESLDAAPSDGSDVVEASEEAVVMPGLVDTHVHVNEPGRTDWEGFRTATRAAAAGGVTTLVDMPLNSIPPTTTLEGLQRKLEAARGQCHMDVGFWGGVVPGNLSELPKLQEAGVVGFKCFLVPSGVEEFPHVTESELRPAMRALAEMDALLIVHAELPGPIDAAIEQEVIRNDRDPRRFQTFLRTRPRAAEDEAINLVIRLCRETGARAHIVHHSSSDALGALREARESGVRITAETCPHYLFFAAEDVPEGATEFKCCPPIRERENRKKLWAALESGVIDMIVSDHSPAPPEMKAISAGDFLEAWGGISSLQLRLAVVWTLLKERGLSLNQLAEWTARQPAHLVRLDKRKGAIEEGCDADMVIWNPEAKFTVEPAMIHHRHKLTPYMGQELYGVVEATYLRGEKIYERGEFSESPVGHLIIAGED